MYLDHNGSMYFRCSKSYSYSHAKPNAILQLIGNRVSESAFQRQRDYDINIFHVRGTKLR